MSDNYCIYCRRTFKTNDELIKHTQEKHANEPKHPVSGAYLDDMREMMGERIGG